MVVNFTCDNFAFVSNNEGDFKWHDAEKHKISSESGKDTEKEESMETDQPTEECKDKNKRVRNKSGSNSPSPPTKKSTLHDSSLQEDDSSLQKDDSSLQEEVAKLSLNEESLTSLNAKVSQLEKALEKLENNHANVINEYSVLKLEKEKLKEEISLERK